MAQSIEPLQSFTFLTENIPQWLARLDDLTAQCDEQYERFYKLTKEGQIKLSRQKKHDSTETLRGKGDVGDVSQPPVEVMENPDAMPTPTEESHTPPIPTQAPSAAAAVDVPPMSRKRKPASTLSISSGPGRYRTKSMTVVYYDSDIQEGFARLVKDIANARSNLRKGRTTLTFKSRDSVDPKAMMASLSRTRLGTARATESDGDKEKFKSFDEADRDLEESQNLSEKGAHQFLRDGDSRIEIEGMKKRFRAVQTLAAAESKRMKENDQATTSPAATHAVKTSAPSIETGKSTMIESQVNTSKTYPPPLQRSTISNSDSDPTTISTVSKPDIPNSAVLETKQFNFAAAGTIEVDDAASDASSVQIDISALRRITRRV